MKAHTSFSRTVQEVALHQSAAPVLLQQYTIRQRPENTGSARLPASIEEQCKSIRCRLGQNMPSRRTIDHGLKTWSGRTRYVESAGASVIGDRNSGAFGLPVGKIVVNCGGKLRRTVAQHVKSLSSRAAQHFLHPARTDRLNAQPIHFGAGRAKTPQQHQACLRS